MFLLPEQQVCNVFYHKLRYLKHKNHTVGKSESEIVVCFNGGSYFSLVTMKQYHSHLSSKYKFTAKKYCCTFTKFDNFAFPS